MGHRMAKGGTCAYAEGHGGPCLSREAYARREAKRLERLQTPEGRAAAVKATQKHERGNRQKTAAQRRAWRQANRDRSHAWSINALYGLTADDYAALHEFQGGKCFICQRATGKTKRLSVDHDHNVGCGHERKKGCPECIRGLLCSPCNIFLGRMRDSVEAFERAILYLQRPPFQQMRARKDLQKQA